jgi:reactive chlorine resistance protein C
MLLTSGLTKFTPAEAQFIRPLVGHSPFLAWLYGLTDVQGVSNLIGAVEIGIAALLAVHRWWPRPAAVGGVCGAVQFLITVSFMFTTPSPSPELLGFLSKDVLLFGIAVWLTGESLRVAGSGG